MSSTQDVKYRWIDGAERLERYVPGGYHPVRIGDVLAGRYEIVHKLGFGTYSTVWLARDNHKGTAYIAVKVSTADAPPQEIEILNSLAQSQPNHPGWAAIPIVWHQFLVKGPNGEHMCYVTSPARSSVAAAKSCCCFPISTARTVVAELILAVAYIHASGFIHGDIHLGNTLLRLPSSFNCLSTQQLYEKHGKPHAEPVLRLDKQPLTSNVPPQAIVPVWIGKRANELLPDETHVVLSDFGEAFLPSANRTANQCRSPLPVTPPEALFDPQRFLTFSSDIWTLACAIWSIIGMRPLFDATLATRDDIVSQQMDIIGASSLPSEWWNAWVARHEYFDEGRWPTDSRSTSLPLENAFKQEIQQVRREERMEELGTAEAAAILDMLRKMLVFRPEERAIAESIVVSDWMVNWGLPELQ